MQKQTLSMNGPREFNVHPFRLKGTLFGTYLKEDFSDAGIYVLIRRVIFRLLLSKMVKLE